MNHPVMKAGDYAKAFETALNEGNLDRLLALYEPDALLRSPQGEISASAAGVRAEMHNLIAAKARMENRARHTLAHGDTALIVVDWTLELSLPHGENVRQQGTATNVIRFDAVHGWRMIVANPLGID